MSDPRRVGANLAKRQGRADSRASRNSAPPRASQKVGRVTALTPSLRVDGKVMSRLDQYTPAIGDRVVYLGGRDPVVLGKVVQ